MSLSLAGCEMLWRLDSIPPNNTADVICTYCSDLEGLCTAWQNAPACTDLNVEFRQFSGINVPHTSLGLWSPSSNSTRVNIHCDTSGFTCLRNFFPTIHNFCRYVHANSITSYYTVIALELGLAPRDRNCSTAAGPSVRRRSGRNKTVILLSCGFVYTCCVRLQCRAWVYAKSVATLAPHHLPRLFAVCSLITDMSKDRMSAAR